MPAYHASKHLVCIFQHQRFVHVYVGYQKFQHIRNSVSEVHTQLHATITGSHSHCHTRSKPRFLARRMPYTSARSLSHRMVSIKIPCTELRDASIRKSWVFTWKVSIRKSWAFTWYVSIRTSWIFAWNVSIRKSWTLFFTWEVIIRKLWTLICTWNVSIRKSWTCTLNFSIRRAYTFTPVAEMVLHKYRWISEVHLCLILQAAFQNLFFKIDGRLTEREKQNRHTQNRGSGTYCYLGFCGQFLSWKITENGTWKYILTVSIFNIRSICCINREPQFWLLFWLFWVCLFFTVIIIIKMILKSRW